MIRLKGEITVFLSLVLVILVSVLFTVIDAARSHAAAFQTECVADMALQSALAEYNRELLEQYDLLFTDIGYGTEEGGYILLEQHLLDYMEENFHAEGTFFSGEIRDLLRLSAVSAVIVEAAGAADGGGMVLERAAVDYMKDRYGMDPSFTAETVAMAETVREENFLGTAMEEKRLENERKIDSVDTTVEDEDGKKHKIPVNNPADNVNSKRGSSGILKMVTEKNGISEREIDLTDYPSYRTCRERDGFLFGEAEISAAEDLLFQKYLMEKCGSYTHEKGGGGLTYETEYILAGKNTDRENLRTVVNRLLVIREAANFVYLLSDAGKMAEAEGLAAALSVVTLFPELKDLVKLSILIGWAYAESVNDVKILLSGGKVPLLKSSASWRMDLKNAMKLKPDEVPEDGGEGFPYEGYLYALLAVTDRQERNRRFMDIVEMNVRETEGNRGFRIDNCIRAFTAELYTCGVDGQEYMLTRRTGYLK